MKLARISAGLFHAAVQMVFRLSSPASASAFCFSFCRFFGLGNVTLSHAQSAELFTKSAKRKGAGLKGTLLPKSTQAKFTAWSAAQHITAQTAVPRSPQEVVFALAAAEGFKFISSNSYVTEYLFMLNASVENSIIRGRNIKA